MAHPHDPAQFIDASEHHLVNRQTLAKIVGYLAMFLPFGLFALGYLMSCAFDTISHYFYGPLAGGLFVGVACVVALALYSYSGKTALETRMARLAALSLLIVAFIPTEQVGCEGTTLPARVFVTAEVSADQETVVLKPFDGEDTPSSDDQGVPVDAHFQWADGAALLHTIAAGVFILVLAYFCFFIFTRTDQAHYRQDKPDQLTKQKLSRNRKYRQSGWAIVFSLIALGIGLLLTGELARLWDYYNGTFVFESVAVLAFARSWLLKGRALHYGALADENEKRAMAICGAASAP